MRYHGHEEKLTSFLQFIPLYPQRSFIVFFFFIRSGPQCGSCPFCGRELWVLFDILSWEIFKVRALELHCFRSV